MHIHHRKEEYNLIIQKASDSDHCLYFISYLFIVVHVLPTLDCLACVTGIVHHHNGDRFKSVFEPGHCAILIVQNAICGDDMKQEAISFQAVILSHWLKGLRCPAT
jgi:hypothetical protein